MEMIDEPRPREDIEAALRCLQSEVVRNPVAMAKNGEPLTIHYIVVIDALRELLALRGSTR